MPSERVQRQIEGFLDEAEAALAERDWQRARDLAERVLTIDPESEDARSFIAMAGGDNAAPAVVPTSSRAQELPTSFVDGRYTVERFLGEGGKKRVYLAHDQLLDRDVAFALIKTEGLDEVGRERIAREAQAMGRLGTHPRVVSVFDLGEHTSADGSTQPYIVTELMGGGDVEALLEDAEESPPLGRTLEIATAVCRGLEFAHAKDVVHRDLKPGNVWLTEEGVAKIGDFGLAISLDRSRLTQHGMMVGTVAYMPPEQALGGETTPQADLYSLGAMLYELVTGRRPFVGEDPTAIISQHINTQPVAPSWHSEHCPPDLEELILHLLAKAPEDRPATASEVLAALEAVDPAAASARDSGANPLDRLARGVFVGREAELERLRTAFDEAFSGRGQVVMLVGEPGIGKTRTAQELETYARMRGAQVLWGRAHESSGAPAYWPWLQVGRAYRGLVGRERLSALPVEQAVELQRLFPGLRDIVPDLPEPPPVADEGAQFRLFDAMTAFLRDASEQTPLLVTLDDLHTADKPTLLLLAHLAREIGRARLLVIGTYRDTDLDRTHPLAEALVEMNREQLFSRLPLRGLSREEVASYVGSVANLEPSRELIDHIYEETEGNPFFLSEVGNLMAEEGTLTADSLSDVAIPEGVREALGRRLDRLSPEANELLTVAAVAGRLFTHGLLGAVSAHDDGTLLTLVEEALEARVIEEEGAVGEYRFTHALMQETLLAELSAARRVRLHATIGEALEALYGEAAEEHAAELAGHYVESAALQRDHAGRAARYSKLAGEQAEASLAWAEAARHYGNCLRLAVTLDAGEEEEIDEAALHAALGRIQRDAGNWVEAWSHFTEAVDGYRERGEGVEVARVAIEALRRRFLVSVDDRKRPTDAALSAVGDEHEELTSRLLAERAVVDFSDAGAQDAARSRGIAERLGLDLVLALLEQRDGNAAMNELKLEKAEVLLRSASLRFEAAGDAAGAAYALLDEALCTGLRGDLGRTREIVERFLSVAREARLESLAGTALLHLMTLSNATGDFDEAEVIFSEIPSSSPAGLFAESYRACMAALGGDFGTAREEIARFAEARIPALGWAWYPIEASALHYIGDDDGARRALADSLSVADESTGIWLRVAVLGLLDDALPALGTDDDVRAWYAESVKWGAVRTTNFAQLMDRVRGNLAVRLDLVDEAAQHFRTGLEWAERERCPVEAGRCLQGLAEVAERRGDHEQAMEHLDRAGELFSRHGAKLYLDQVLAKKEILKA